MGDYSARWKDLRTPSVFTVGTAYRAAIERWEEEQQHEAGRTHGADGAPACPTRTRAPVLDGDGTEDPAREIPVPDPGQGRARAGGDAGAHANTNSLRREPWDTFTGPS